MDQLVLMFVMLFAMILAEQLARRLGIASAVLMTLFGRVVALIPAIPVAATAMAGKLGLPRRLVVVLGGEGLFNDVTAIVIYSVAIQAVVTGRFSASRAAGEFATSEAMSSKRAAAKPLPHAENPACRQIWSTG